MSLPKNLLTWLPLLLVACQSEPEPMAGGQPVGPPPDGSPGAPDVGGPDRDAPITARLEGVLIHEAFEGGMLQVDVVGVRDGTPQVVGMERYEQPGPFRIAVRGEFEEVELLVYVDTEGDGPSAGDLRASYSGNPISLVGVEVVDGLEIDVSLAEVQDGAPAEDGAETGPPLDGDPGAGPPPVGDGPPMDGPPPEGAPPPGAPPPGPPLDGDAPPPLEPPPEGDAPE